MELFQQHDVSIEWLLQNVTDSVDWYHDYMDMDWEILMREKVVDSQFLPLVEAIQEEGFTVPVCITYSEFKRGWTMGNGHHRLFAAILLGLETIPVWTSTYDDYMCESVTEGSDIREDWYGTNSLVDMLYGD